MKDVQRWIDKGRVMQNGLSIVQKNFELIGDVDVIVFEPSSIGLKPIFETSNFAIFDKPSGVLVHPSNRFTEYSITHEAKYLFGAESNIVHRLDKETSGLIVVSKNKKAEIELKQLFEKREIKKGYIALIKGKLTNELFIDAPIKKNREFKDIKLKVQISEDGKVAQTLIRPIKYNKEKNQTLVEALPKTGRQHQIRVHLFHVKHPIVGDPIYGVDYESADRYLNGLMSEKERIEKTGVKRLMLHANWLEFRYKHRYKIYSKSIFIKENCFD
jgi:23S rRNA pseudouridine1911/1915/1917 synthase